MAGHCLLLVRRGLRTVFGLHLSRTSVLMSTDGAGPLWYHRRPFDPRPRGTSNSGGPGELVRPMAPRALGAPHLEAAHLCARHLGHAPRPAHAAPAEGTARRRAAVPRGPDRPDPRRDPDSRPG